MAPPDKKRKRNPWDSSKDKAVHPKAPVGGGGQGGFSPKVPLNPSRNPAKPLPHPQSPVGRNTAPIDPPRDTSAPPPPALDMGALMAERARKMVGMPIIHDPQNSDRAECFDMVDAMLNDMGAKSARDFMKSVGPDDNYVWGPVIAKDKIQPGDILQIRNSELVLNVKITYSGNKVDRSKYVTKETNTTMERGHHTAVVIAVNPDGSFQVSEQHVLDVSRKQLSATIRENTFPLKDVSSSETRNFTSNNEPIVETTTRSWHVVKGTVWAYRPVEKKK
jgi:hypothetical protein